MPTTVTNPLGELVQGMLQGYGLGMQLKHQQMQQEAHQRAMAAADREAQVKDIQTQMMLEQNARPVNAGTVTEPGSALPGLNVNGVDIPTGKVPDYVRPVDKSRRVKYADQEYELYTPDEQIKRQVDRAQQLKRADSIPIQTPQHLREIGLPETIWVPNDHLLEYADKTGQMEPVATPQAYQELGGRPTVPTRMLPSVISTVNSAENRKAADTRAAAANTSREKVAGDNRAAADKRAADAAKSREKIASDRNATALTVADKRRDTSVPTANAQGVQNRFQQRQLEADQRELRNLEAKEADLHAKKLKEGATKYPNSEQRNGVLSGLDLQIKGIQESKKKLIDKWQSKGGMPQQTTQPAPGTVPHVNAKGQTIVFNGTAWVDQKTGQPVN